MRGGLLRPRWDDTQKSESLVKGTKMRPLSLFKGTEIRPNCKKKVLIGLASSCIISIKTPLASMVLVLFETSIIVSSCFSWSAESQLVAPSLNWLCQVSAGLCKSWLVWPSLGWSGQVLAGLAKSQQVSASLNRSQQVSTGLARPWLVFPGLDWSRQVLIGLVKSRWDSL